MKINGDTFFDGRNTILWKHDCEACEYDCTIESGKHLYDIYFCRRGALGHTVVARFGDQGHDYVSIPEMLLEKMGDTFPNQSLFRNLCEINQTRKGPL